MSDGVTNREGGEVGLLEALVVVLDGADGARPRLLQCQDTLRRPMQLLALLKGSTCY